MKSLNRFQGQWQARLMALLSLLLLSMTLQAQEQGGQGGQDAQGETEGQDKACAEAPRYTFSWSLRSECALEPRGGTTQGAPVTLDPNPHPGWQALQEEGLSELEKDRRAILAMAGPYRASFEFLETVGYIPDFSRQAPYQSWATEYVYVVEEREDFISLQHIIVMFMQDEQGRIQGPFVQKHWRQDWQYEKPEILVYAGDGTWEQRQLDEEDYQGTWAQAVYQVDDSPRYESYGEWRHEENFSTWLGAPTWRPIPRRESREGYDVLEANNRHTIIPNGWVHEEENYKLRLNEQGEPQDNMPYVAKEVGLNRYERIIDFDFSAGDEYWESTGAFWQDVRMVWQEYLDENERLQISGERNGVPLFAALFQRAEQARQAQNYDSDAALADIREILSGYIQ